MEQVTVKLNGVGIMLAHNERLANPLDEIVQQIKVVSSKRKKTVDDYTELARLELIGGAYLTDAGTFGIPTWNVLQSIKGGAKLNKLGAAVARAVIPVGADVIPVHHDGPDTVRAAWEEGNFDQRSVGVGMKRITRTRPRFSNWSLVAEFVLDTEALDMEDFTMAAENAGRLVGLGDYRPRYGRYEVEVEAA